jgi:hypothetical protein
VVRSRATTTRAKPTARAKRAAFVAELLSLPVTGMLLAEVGAAVACDDVAGPTAAVVLVLDAVGVVVGAVLELLVVDVVVGAVVVVVVLGAVVVVVVVVVGGGTCDAQVWLRLNCGSLPRAALRSRPMVAVPPSRVSSVGVTT